MSVVRQFLLVVGALALSLPAQERPETPATLRAHADKLAQEGKVEEALKTLERARGFAEASGEEVEIARCWFALGELLLERTTRYTDALRAHERALTIRQRVDQRDHPDVAGSLERVALCLYALGKPAEALPRLEAEFAMSQRLYKDDHPAKASSLNSLALCLKTIGKPAEALPKYEAALAMRQRLYKDDHPDIAQSLNNIAACLMQIGKPAEALPKSEAALAMEQRLHKDDYPNVAISLNNVAFCLNALGKQAEALPKYEAALAMRQRLYKDDHPYVAQSLNNVASCLNDLGKPAEALPKYEAALAMEQRLYQDDHPNVATRLNNVASCLNDLGKSAEALPKYEAALAMRQRLYKDDHPDVAESLNNLAGCLLGLGKSAEALPKYEAALAMRQRLYKDDHPDVAESLNNLAGCLLDLGKPAEALPNVEAALAMHQRLYKVDHPLVATSLNNVAACLSRLGELAEALPKDEAALAMKQRLYKTDHPDVALSLSNAARCLDDLGRSAEALPKLEAAVAMEQRLYRYDHQALARSLDGVASCLNHLGKPAEALPRFEAALAMRERLFQGDHPDVATSLSNVASCLHFLGRAAEALTNLEAALAMGQRLHKDDHPNVATRLNNVASCLNALGKQTEALPKYEAALAMFQRLFEGDHPDVATSLNNVASCLDSLGRPAEALPNLEAALAMRERLFQGEHPDVATSLNNVATCLKSLGKAAEALPKYEAALAMQRRLLHSEHPDLATSLVNLARLHFEQQRPDQAEPLLAGATAMLELLRESARTLEERDRTDYFAELKRGNVFGLLRRVRVALDDPEAGLDATERGRGSGLRDLLARSELDPLAEAERRVAASGDQAPAAEISKVRARVEAADRELSRLFHKVARVSGERRLEEEERARQLASVHAELGKAHEEHKEAMRERARIVAEFVPLGTAASVTQIRAALETGELLLVYALDPEESHLFVVDRERVEVVPLVIKRQEVTSELPKYLERLQGSRKDLAGFSRTLVPEAVWTRVRKASRVVVVPDGALHSLPFEGLAVGEGFWLDEGPPIAYVPSGTVLRWVRERTKTQDNAPPHLVALGDPIFATEDQPAVPEQGALIANVQEGSQAEKAGLRAGDVLLRYADADLKDDTALRKAIAKTQEAQAGKANEATIALRVWREGEVRDVQVQPGRLGVVVGRGNARAALEAGYGRSLEKDLEERERAALRGGGLGKLKQLPRTRDEVNAIAKAIEGHKGRVERLLGAEATEEKLFALAPKASYLHLATHGLADEVAQMSYSALALTMPKTPTQEDDGFLMLRDLLQHWGQRLPSCRMVVLSACRTQVGPQQVDEAPHALPVGFLYAGASSVVATLWPVPDASTAELMADFYRRILAQGEQPDRLKALTEAKKELRRRHAPPWVWAPFLYIGSPR